MVFLTQYLEYFDPRQHTPVSVRQRLREAFARLPLQIVCMGWGIPPAVREVCAEECSRAGAELYRWHLLLVGDGTFLPRPEWQVIGVEGQAVPGFRSLPEFTFICPNQPAVHEAVLEHLERSLQGGAYQGVFLDRIRFPSPAEDPGKALACFCPDCIAQAAAEGVDLPALQGKIQRLVKNGHGRYDIARELFQTGGALESLFAFRQRSIQRLVQAAAGVARQAGCLVGLDIFSPTLARMVGQAPGELSWLSDWTKPMSYAHAMGPSGLPFELSALVRWLVHGGAREQESLRWLAQASGIELPASLESLQGQGLSPAVLERETRKARRECSGRLYPGMALVELPGVNQISPGQVLVEVEAYQRGGADGLVLAWDLWSIPLEQLEAVNNAWK